MLEHHFTKANIFRSRTEKKQDFSAKRQSFYLDIA